MFFKLAENIAVFITLDYDEVWNVDSLFTKQHSRTILTFSFSILWIMRLSKNNYRMKELVRNIHIKDIFCISKSLSEYGFRNFTYSIALSRGKPTIILSIHVLPSEYHPMSASTIGQDSMGSFKIMFSSKMTISKYGSIRSISITMGDAETYISVHFSMEYLLSHCADSKAIFLRGLGKRLIHSA